MAERVLRRREVSRALILVAAALLFITPVLSAATLEFRKCAKPDTLPNGVLILDLTGDVEKDGAPARFLDRSDLRDARLMSELTGLFEECPAVDLAVVQSFMKKAGLTKVPTARFVADGGSIAVVAFHIGKLVEIQVTENARDTQLSVDFGNLLELIKKLRKAGGAAGADVIVARADYTLVEPRATVTFNAIPYEETLDPDGGPSTTEAKDPVKVAAILTGAIEHFRLSANLPVNSVKELEYDEESGIPKLKETPREFLAGIDWFYGDVLRDDYPLADARRLGVKGLVRFSKTPLDSLGAVVAYRYKGISIIAGPIWTKQDVKTGTGEDGKDIFERKYKQAWRVGLGFDLATALSWVSSAGDDEKK